MSIQFEFSFHANHGIEDLGDDIDIGIRPFSLGIERLGSQWRQIEIDKLIPYLEYGDTGRMVGEFPTFRNFQFSADGNSQLFHINSRPNLRL